MKRLFAVISGLIDGDYIGAFCKAALTKYTTGAYIETVLIV